MELTKIKDLTNIELKSIRDGFGDGLVSIGGENEDVVALTADLESSLRMTRFKEKFPERFFDVGVAEQNMAGVAAGLALEGKVPYMGSFSSFSPGRNFDQIRVSIAMMEANVKIIGSHAGFSYGPDGMSVQILEDIAMMRALPNMRILVPSDAVQAARMTEMIAGLDAPVYLRLGRQETPILYPDDYNFQFGKAELLTDGSHVTIITTGYMVFRSLLAAQKLAKKGINVRILNIHTIKPLDTGAILESISITKCGVVAEEAQSAGGLGGAVAEVLAQNYPVPLEFVGVDDEFGESGEYMDINKSRHLMEDDIVVAVERVLQRR